MQFRLLWSLFFILFSVSARAQVRCEDLFLKDVVPHERLQSSPRFSRLKEDTVVSLYINRNLISKNQEVQLEGKRYIVRDWYNTRNGAVLLVETLKKGKSKILKASEFKHDLIVVDYVRLKDLLDYQNPRIIQRYMRDFNSTRVEAEKVFKELMKWFFLLHRYASEGLYFEDNPRYFELGMYDETQKIDDMWHTFILFTIDYTDFGWNHLGYYQHHQPFDKVVPKSKAQTLRERQLMYEFIAASVGLETLQAWYVNLEFSAPSTPIKDHIPVDESFLNEEKIP